MPTNTDDGAALLGWMPLLLQTGDPLFPTGAYAHSFGLEEAVRLGVLKDEATLRQFLERQIVPNLREFDLPYLCRAHRAAVEGDLETLWALDAELDAWKPAREWRSASRQIGSRRLQMLLQIAPTPLLERFSEATRGGAHHLVVSALQGAEMPLDAVLIAYYYQTVAGYCSAALKLIRIGQEGCQRALRGALDLARPAIRAARETGVDEAGWFDPILEIASMRHERAFERLFIS